MADAPKIERALVITAHPDDVDFGAAGTVATWTDAGVDVAYCIVTDGDAGGHDRTVARTAMAETRRVEQTTAAKHVGVTTLHFLGYPDGRLESMLDLRRDLSRVIRQVQPDLVVCPSPERKYQRIYASHPDHLAAGEASLCAVYPDARNPFAHTELLDEGLEPWSVPEVWMMATSSPGRLRRHHRRDRSQARRAAQPREPAPATRDARRDDPRLGRDDRRARRLRKWPLRRRLPASRDFLKKQFWRRIRSNIDCYRRQNVGLRR